MKNKKYGAIEREDIINAYRYILGREPESEDVIRMYVENVSDWRELRRIIMGSREFLNKYQKYIVECYREEDKKRIDVDISDDKRQILFDLVMKEWEDLGKNDPYWSVLTHERYKINNIDQQKLIEFYESGDVDVKKLLKNLKEIKDGGFENMIICELGAGVGRCTYHLSKYFNSVIACDISKYNLSICDKYISDNKIDNVNTVLINNPNNMFDGLPQWDVFYSVITLQHNPPPVQYHILDRAFKKIKKGGIAFFQTWSEGILYEFNIEKYISNYKIGMKMHCLPIKYILKLAKENDMILHNIYPDGYTGLVGSYTYVMEKK